MDIQAVKQQLQNELVEIDYQLGSLAEHDPAHNEVRDIDNEIEDDSIESEAGFRSQSISDELTSRKQLTQKTINKIDQGTYGTCERCGKQIEQNRLTAVPTSLYCLDCQEIIDTKKSILANA